MEIQSIVVGIIIGLVVGIAVPIISIPILEYLEKPEVIITNMQAKMQPWPGKNFGNEITVFNEGNDVASFCIVFLEADENDPTNKSNSGFFSLNPNEEKIIDVYGIIFEKSGKYSIETHVECMGYKPLQYVKTYLTVTDPAIP